MDFSKYFYKIIFDTKEQLRDFQAKRNDVGRGIEIEIAENGIIENLGNASMLFVAKKPDGTKVLYSAGKKDNSFTIEFSRQLFTVAGRVQCELKLLGEKGEVLGSKNFGIVVAQDLQMDLNSNNDFQVIKKCLDQLGTIPEKVEQLTNAVQSAENFTTRTIEIENAETARVRAETARNQKETERQTAETSRTQAESQRQAGETARARAETTRVEAERLRVQKLQEVTTQAEQFRTAETQRVEAERARVQAETTRTEAENQRARAERERASNHSTQSQALTEAQRAYTTNKQEIDTLLPTMQGLKTQTEEVLSSLRNISVGNVASEIAELRQRIDAQASTVNEQVLNQKIAELTQGLPDEVNTVKKIGNHLHHLRGNFSQRMDAAESKIRNLETGISGKVNASDFNSYKSEAETTFVAGSALTSAISQAKTEVARDFVAKSTYASDLQNIRSQLAQPQGVNETEVNRLIAAQVATLPTTESVQQLITSGTSDFVRKEEGKGLSTNDYTTEEKNKLAGISVAAITRLRPVDALTSTNALQPLSARQGKILKDMIDQIKGSYTPLALEQVEITAVRNGTDPLAIDRLFAKTSNVGATLEQALWLVNTGMASKQTFEEVLADENLFRLFLESEKGIKALQLSRVATQKLLLHLNGTNKLARLWENQRLATALATHETSTQAIVDIAKQLHATNFWGSKEIIVWLLKYEMLAKKMLANNELADKIVRSAAHSTDQGRAYIYDNVTAAYTGWAEERKDITGTQFTIARPCICFGYTQKYQSYIADSNYTAGNTYGSISYIHYTDRTLNVSEKREKLRLLTKDCFLGNKNNQQSYTHLYIKYLD